MALIFLFFFLIETLEEMTWHVYCRGTEKNERRAQVAVDNDEKTESDVEAQVESTDQASQRECDKPKLGAPSTSSVLSR
jgi:hypothetical protein